MKQQFAMAASLSPTPLPLAGEGAIASNHFSFVLSAALGAAYRRIEQKTLAAKGLVQDFPNNASLREFHVNYFFSA